KNLQQTYEIIQPITKLQNHTNNEPIGMMQQTTNPLKRHNKQRTHWNNTTNIDPPK
ncbi:18650_t:CDS:1, partial [Gigaspora rosea]